MKIGPRDFVLEIGSGNNPRPRSDVLCDKMIEDDSERGGSIVSDRPLIEADAQRLPFRDGAFDYVICSHVLEHVEDPGAMLEELMRVARRGYIETPSEVAERLYGWPFHRNVVRSTGRKLVIRRKDFVSPFGDLFHRLAAHDPEFMAFHRTHDGLLLVRHEWEGRIDYAILPEGAASDRSGGEGVGEGVEFPRDGMGRSSGSGGWLRRAARRLPRPLVTRVKSWIARARPRPRRDLREIVVCPACRGAVRWDPGEIRCEACAARYPIVGGIPRLLPRGDA